MRRREFITLPGGLMTYGATASEIYTSAAEQVAKSWVAPRRVSCRCDRQRGSSWSSTSGLPRRSDSQSRRRCWREPTR